ncbi:MAG: apolipoprotein N-acyltransferase [Myxococcota bacterium]
MGWWKRKSLVGSALPWWKSAGVAFVSGAVMSVSQPTLLPGMSAPLSPALFFAFFAFFGLIPIYILFWNKPLKQTLLYSYFAGVVYFVISIFWVVIAMNVYGRLNYSVSILGLILLSGYCAITWGGGITLSEFFRRRLNLPVYLTLPVAWTAFEYLRNYLFSGFPWSQLGYTQAANYYFIQIADIFGVYGVTFAVALIAGALIHIVAYLKAMHHSPPRNGVALIVVMLVVVYGYGFLRAHDIELALKRADSLRIALLQGNIDQNKKMQSRRYRGEILNSFKKLAQQADRAGAELIVWPEASYPRTLSRDTMDLKKTGIAEDYEFKSPQVIGVPLYYWEMINGKEKRRLLNSSFLVDPDLNVLDRYDKSHLVPFGEYVPLEDFLPIDKLVPGLGTFQKGVEVRPLQYDKMKFGVLICYEGIFPEISRELAREGAEFLLNITNDAWYGVSSAPYQHLSFYVFRAIETRRSVGRATNTGVSAFIDATGRVEQPTSLFVKTLTIGELKRMNTRTVYLAIGDVLPQLCWLALVLLSIIIFVLRKRLT